MASVSNVSSARPAWEHDITVDLSSLKEVPDSYAWAELVNDSSPSDPSDFGEPFPVINLNDPDAVSRMGRAFETWGMFLITGHGVPINTIDRLETQSARFFALPTEKKLIAARQPGDFFGYGKAGIARFFESAIWSEALTTMDSPINWARQIWPDDYAQFSDVVEEYCKEMKVLTARIMSLLISSLGISKEEVEWAGPEGDLDWYRPVLQLNWYPRCPDPNRALGFPAHTDSLFLTILYSSTMSGLQVHREHEGQAHWITVPSVPGSFLIFAADLLQFFSNGRIQSPLHRVLVNHDKPRISAAFFVTTPKESLIEPSPKLVDPAQGPLYKPVKPDDYLDFKLEHFQDALELIKT